MVSNACASPASGQISRVPHLWKSAVGARTALAPGAMPALLEDLYNAKFELLGINAAMLALRKGL
jgi:hypothetical protein